MEAVKEPPLLDSAVDGVKISIICDKSNEKEEGSKVADVCHKSNGVADSESKEPATLDPKATAENDNIIETEIIENIVNTEVCIEHHEDSTELAPSTAEPDTIPVQPDNNSAIDENVPSLKEAYPLIVEEGVKLEQDSIVDADDSKILTSEELVIESENVIESTTDRVTFQTEVLVESNDNEVPEILNDDTKIEQQESNNILSELGESIEFSEALRSSDVTDNVENNNCSGKQEVFNKEELLDILEGNNDEQTGNLLNINIKALRSDKLQETQLALEQLTRLKKKPKKLKSIDRFPRKKSEKKVIKYKAKPDITRPQVCEESIVEDLVKDWDDDEEREEKSLKLLEESKNLKETCDGIENEQVSKTKVVESSNRTSVDQPVDDKISTRSADERQPQRRFGRVIKKKVIFDPDNPDTFTKSKVLGKSKEHEQEKDQISAKKMKPDPDQRSKSKSPISKLQWKKPSPKNSKQNKRLTEVDKLLMDEGAVNMIYQLTPEAPKGKKNMKTKAEFIKRIQSSSTPDTKEMKFRERKKDSRYEEGEPRKILGGKQRPSLNSSVKSPSVSEDFEAHSADDSIIYRRHSSSSYSSSCMSPRRLSDVEMNTQTTRNSHQGSDLPSQGNNEINSCSPAVDNVTFMSDNSEVIGTDTINKDDCLSIKEKLKSKLNLALNKRKHESSKADKPLKIKKVMKVHENTSSKDFEHLSLRYDGKLAVLSVQKPGSNSNLEVIKELECALKLIESNKDISVTLLMPECLMTYSDLDLRSLLDEDKEKRLTCAQGIAESIRSLLHTVEQHSKLLCAGANSKCTGISLALVGLSDVTLASERSSFAIAAKSHGPSIMEPGISVLTAYRNISQPVLNELIVFGRRLSAVEALHNGLVSRVLWPEKFNEQALNIAKDIATQSAHNIWLKKQILSLKKSSSNYTFLTCLEKERDLFIEYWTSDEGQELLRSTHNATPSNT